MAWSSGDTSGETPSYRSDKRRLALISLQLAQSPSYFFGKQFFTVPGLRNGDMPPARDTDTENSLTGAEHRLAPRTGESLLFGGHSSAPWWNLELHKLGIP